MTTRSNRASSVISVAALVTGLACGAGLGPASAQQYEAAGAQPTTSVLSPQLLQGPHYKVADQVLTVGYFHIWQVDTDFGHFAPVGDGALLKLIREIGAISALKDISGTEAFAKAVADAAKSPFQFGYNLITSPVDTVTALPTGVFRMFQNIGGSVSNEKNAAEDSSIEQALQVSSWKRDYAAKAGVDVYSSNKVLQEELNRIGWAGAIGGLSVSAATMPLSGPAALALKNTRLAQKVTNVLAAEPPSRLRIINEEKLAKMGISSDLAKQFLDSQAYSPSRNTVLVASLNILGPNVAGREAMLKQAMTAGDESEAAFYVASAQMLAGYSEKVGPLKELFGSGRLVMAITQAGRMLVPAPVDRVTWSQRTDQVTAAITDVAGRGGMLGKVDLWLTGTASDRAKKEIAKRGLTLTENIDQAIGIIY
jgi:hypothetical protein